MHYGVISVGEGWLLIGDGREGILRWTRVRHDGQIYTECGGQEEKTLKTVGSKN